MPAVDFDDRFILEHSYNYAAHKAGARHSVALAYSRHYTALAEAEDDPKYWPSHADEFYRWLNARGISDWRDD